MIQTPFGRLPMAILFRRLNLTQNGEI